MSPDRIGGDDRCGVVGAGPVVPGAGCRPVDRGSHNNGRIGGPPPGRRPDPGRSCGRPHRCRGPPCERCAFDRCRCRGEGAPRSRHRTGTRRATFRSGPAAVGIVRIRRAPRYLCRRRDRLARPRLRRLLGTGPVAGSPPSRALMGPVIVLGVDPIRRHRCAGRDEEQRGFGNDGQSASTRAMTPGTRSAGSDRWGRARVGCGSRRGAESGSPAAVPAASPVITDAFRRRRSPSRPDNPDPVRWFGTGSSGHRWSDDRIGTRSGRSPWSDAHCGPTRRRPGGFRYRPVTAIDADTPMPGR